MKDSVLLDTSFFIRLLNDEDSLHKNALNYFRYFLENDIILKISTISIAEYCVRGDIEDLPLRNLQIVPFNSDHAKKTGQFAQIIFEEKSKLEKDTPRILIPNDSKLFAQSDIEKNINYFVTSDSRSVKALKILKARVNTKFEIIDISIPHSEHYGILNLY